MVGGGRDGKGGGQRRCGRGGARHLFKGSPEGTPDACAKPVAQSRAKAPRGRAKQRAARPASKAATGAAAAPEEPGLGKAPPRQAANRAAATTARRAPRQDAPSPTTAVVPLHLNAVPERLHDEPWAARASTPEPNNVPSTPPLTAPMNLVANLAERLYRSVSRSRRP